jgi:hypothetical protein
MGGGGRPSAFNAGRGSSRSPIRFAAARRARGTALRQGRGTCNVRVRSGSTRIQRAPSRTANGGDADHGSLLTTFCSGSTGASCADSPEGTGCPGDPTVCIKCAPDAYVQALSECRCTSGTWDCFPPEAGTVTCPNPLPDTQFNADPSCSVPYVGDARMDAAPDAGAGEAGVDAATDAGGEGGSRSASAGPSRRRAQSRPDSRPTAPPHRPRATTPLLASASITGLSAPEDLQRRPSPVAKGSWRGRRFVGLTTAGGRST